MRVVTPASPGARSLPDPRIDAVTHTGFVVSCFAFASEHSTSAAAPSPIGEHISRKIAAAEWGDGVVLQLAQYIARTQPGLRGFTRDNLFRMKQFYETYCGEAIVGALARQLPWTHNLIILGRSKRPEESEFYLRMAVQERWSSRQLERQFNTAFFERAMLSPVKVSPAVTETHPEAQDVFKDAYVVEFLGLPQEHTENELHRGLLARMKEFFEG